MQRFLIMCRSLTYAQRAASALERAGIAAGLSRAPQSRSVNGCASCVYVRAERLSPALKVLERAGAPHGKLYRCEPDGRYTEVGA